MGLTPSERLRRIRETYPRSQASMTMKPTTTTRVEEFNWGRENSSPMTTTQFAPTYDRRSPSMIPKIYRQEESMTEKMDFESVEVEMQFDWTRRIMVPVTRHSAPDRANVKNATAQCAPSRKATVSVTLRFINFLEKKKKFHCFLP